MHQPKGFVDGTKPDFVCLLNRALYGLKQLPSEWFQDIDKYLSTLFLKRSFSNGNLYYHHLDGLLILIILYVNDVIITGSHKTRMYSIRDTLMENFKMTYLSLTKKFLGLQFSWLPDGILLHQTAYVLSLLAEFGLADCNPCKTPLQSSLKLSNYTGTPTVDAQLYQRMVGKLIFLTHTPPDIAFAVNLVSRYMQQRQLAHMQAVNTILMYLKETFSLGLHYRRGDQLVLTPYIDAD